MTLLLSILLGILFIVLQTACIPPHFLFIRYFDLLLPLVIYVSVFRPAAESIFLVLFFGILMDSLSGSPFGLYSITYVWLLLGVRGSMLFLDAGSYFLFPLILAAALIVEHLLFSIYKVAIPSGEIWVTVLWALITAPLFLLFLNTMFKKCRQLSAPRG